MTVLIATVAPTALAADTFRDDDQSIHESNIEYIAAEGITRGCNPPTNDRFCPQQAVSRAQMAAFLNRALSLAPGTVGFADDDGAFEADIRAVAQAGISKGCNPPANDRFCPGNPVTREQMASFLVRAFGLKRVDVDYFTDDRGSVHEDDINALAAAGVTAGCGSASFCPDEPVTREQMASFLTRSLTGKGVEPPPPAPPPGTPPPPPSDDPPGTSAPSGSVHVNPGQSLQQLVDKNPDGTTFYLEAGTHRFASVEPDTGDEFVGAPGAVMSGARVLKTFQKEGSLWVATGQTQQGERDGFCQDGYTGCIYPEQLFIDDQPLWQVTEKADVGPGTWYFDYENDRIYFADNPSGRLVETSITATAFGGHAEDVTIRELIIEKYSTPTRDGTIDARAADGWRIENSWIRWNHGIGIRFGDQMTIRSSLLFGNGQLGLSGQGDDLLVESSEIAYNQIAGIKAFGWEGGGAKINRSDGVTIRGNHVHHNHGHGLHTDGSSSAVLYEHNTVTDNDGTGISHETSYQATIRFNTVLRNGLKNSIGLVGSGIFVNSSENVEVHSNVVADNADGIGGQQSDRGDHYLKNLWVHDNVIKMSSGHTGIAATTNEASVFGSWNNRFDFNDYSVEGTDEDYFRWDGNRTFAEWRAAGNDVNGTIQER